jgi:choice-of-anchor C domain-containing protein
VAKSTSKQGNAAANKSAGAHQNLIINGDFEYDPERKGHMQVEKGSDQIYCWTVTSGNVKIVEGGEFTAGYGKKSIDLNGSGPGLISQKIATEPGATYKVKFWLAGDVQGPPPVKSMFVRVGDQSRAWSIDCAGRVHPVWTPVTWKFQAEEPSTTIEFGSTTPGIYGNLVDDISVEKSTSAK